MLNKVATFMNSTATSVEYAASLEFSLPPSITPPVIGDSDRNRLVLNNEGNWVATKAEEARFQGARRVENLIPSSGTGSASLAATSAKTMTLAAGTYTFSMGLGGGTATFSGTGGATGTLDADSSNRTAITKTITAGTLIVTASVETLIDLQVETGIDVSEYISSGVLSSPWHGSNVDSVKYFNDENHNLVISNQVFKVTTNGDNAGYANLTGNSGSFVSTPDSTANSITGDIDIRVMVSLTDWTPASEVTLWGKWLGALNSSYGFNVTTAGRLAFYSSSTGAGADITSNTSSESISFANGSIGHVRITLDVNNGAGNRVATFYTSVDGVSWTQLGSAQSSGVAVSIFDGISTVGNNIDNGVGNRLTGKLYRASIYNGIDGDLVTDFNPGKDAQEGDTTFTSSATGEVYTVNGDASIHKLGLPIDVDGYYTESEGTNLYFPSTAPVTKDLTLSTGNHTLSVHGTGTVTSSDNTATSTGHGVASDGTDITFNVTTGGTVTFTVSGSPTIIQVEEGSYSTSPIETVGSSVTRLSDLGATIPDQINDLSWSLSLDITPTMASTQLTGEIDVMPLGANKFLRYDATNTQWEVTDGTNVATVTDTFIAGQTITLNIDASDTLRIKADSTSGTAGTYDGALPTGDLTLNNLGAGAIKNIKLYRKDKGIAD